MSIQSFDGLYKYHHIAKYGGRHLIFSYSRTPPHVEVDSIDVAYTLQRRGPYARLSLVSKGGQLPRNEVAPGAISSGDYLRISGEKVFGTVVQYLPPSTASRYERDIYTELLMNAD